MRVGIVAGDVVEDDEPGGPNEWRMHLPILLNAWERVVAVDEEEIKGATRQEALRLLDSGGSAGIGTNEMKLLLCAGKAAVDGNAGGREAATKFAGGKIDTDDSRGGLSEASPEIERAATVSADFEDRQGFRSRICSRGGPSSSTT